MASALPTVPQAPWLIGPVSHRAYTSNALELTEIISGLASTKSGLASNKFEDHLPWLFFPIPLVPGVCTLPRGCFLSLFGPTVITLGCILYLLHVGPNLGLRHI